MRDMTPEKAAEMIRRAYGTVTAHTEAGTWMMIAEVADRVDLTIDEIHDGIRHLKATDPRFNLAPESNQKVLTDAERHFEIIYGNQRKHLIAWN